MTLSRRTIGTAFFAFIAALATGMATLALFTAPAKSAPAGFVQRCGIHFCLNGKAYYFAGANTYDMFTYGGSYGDTETQYMDKARIDTQMGRSAYSAGPCAPP